MNQVTIRPNLNTKDQITVHEGRLGRKLDSVYAITIKCDDTVVRKSGNKEAFVNSNKTVHAGLIGTITKLIMPTENSSLIRYNPHKGDKSFTLNGELYVGGGIITMIGHKAYYICGENEAN